MTRERLDIVDINRREFMAYSLSMIGAGVMALPRCQHFMSKLINSIVVKKMSGGG